MVVDYQTHWYPSAYLDSIRGRAAYPHTELVGAVYSYEGRMGDRRLLDRRFFDLEVALADMDEHGIDVMVCSPNLVGEVTMLPLAEARETAQLLNEEVARAQTSSPIASSGLRCCRCGCGCGDRGPRHRDREAWLGGLHLSHRRPSIASTETLPIYRRIARVSF